MAFNTRQKLNSMRYKSFTWKYNPATCTYLCQRTYVAHKYPELAGVELEDMDVNEVVITGKGEFFGSDAYSNWMKLNAEFRTFGPGTFYHPVFTDITQGLMTKLQADMEPRDDYVAYSFEIVGHIDAPDVNTPSVIPSTPSTGTSSSSTPFKVGDVVTFTGFAYSDSYGSMPRSEYKQNVKCTVTQVNYNGTHPIHCSSLGWCRVSDVTLVNSGSTSSSNNTENLTNVYIVKSGDTLFSICAKYGANWQDVATYNNLKNPNSISVGQKITIPYYMTKMYTKLTTAGSGIKNIISSSSSSGGGGGGSGNIYHTLN